MYYITKDRKERSKYDLEAPVANVGTGAGCKVIFNKKDKNKSTTGMMEFKTDEFTDMIPVNMQKHYKALKRRNKLRSQVKQEL